MTFEAELKTHLQEASAVAAVLADRIHPVLRPEEGALPALTYQIVTLDQVDNLGGRDGSLRHFRVQLDYWARKFSDVLALDTAVRARMDTAATNFRSTMLPSGFDDFEPETKLYRRSREFSCWYRET